MSERQGVTDFAARRREAKEAYVVEKRRIAIEARGPCPYALGHFDLSSWWIGVVCGVVWTGMLVVVAIMMRGH